MALLSRDEILTAHDLETEDVDVPEWGGTVRVRMLTGKERDELEAGIVDKSGRMSMRNLRAKLSAACIVDEGGERLLTDADVEALGDKSASALERVFATVIRLNRWSSSDIEELRGNS